MAFDVGSLPSQRLIHKKINIDTQNEVFLHLFGIRGSEIQRLI